jgi:hypothetical protein
MKTIILLACLLIPAVSDAQITRAEDRIRRESNNSRQALTFDQVEAQRFDIGEQVFNFQIRFCSISKLKQIEANRWELPIGDDSGSFGGIAHLPRGGAEAISTIQDGDIVIARIKAGSDPMVIELLGVSALNVWE